MDTDKFIEQAKPSAMMWLIISSWSLNANHPEQAVLFRHEHGTWVGNERLASIPGRMNTGYTTIHHRTDTGQEPDGWTRTGRTADADIATSGQRIL
ncbi:MAG: hypothetical protein H6551_07240 [Chitinophagales bacterium]|nr:hypothetical protein [Chitinophagales bacterium]